MTAKPTNCLRRQIEGLEDRALMSTGVSAHLYGNVLRVTGTDRADRISVIEQNGRMWVQDGSTYARIGPGAASNINIEARSVGRVDVVANGGNDVINLNSVTKPTSVWAGAGNDQVYGGAGNDIIYGGADNDSLAGGAGVDDLRGETGFNLYQDQFDLNRPVVNGCQTTDIRQGTALGSCQTLAVLAELAVGGHDFGKDIVRLDSTHYRVSLRGGTVKTDVFFNGTWNDNDPMPTGGQAEFWPILMQRARMQYWSIPWGNQLSAAQQDYYFDRVKQYSASFGWGFANTSLASYDYNGRKPVTFAPTQYQRNALAAGLLNDLRAGWRFAAGSFNTNVEAYGPGIVSSHAYAVYDVFAQGGTWMVRLYNPWGKDSIQGQCRDGADDGFITLTIDQFRANFSTVYKFAHY